MTGSSSAAPWPEQIGNPVAAAFDAPERLRAWARFDSARQDRDGSVADDPGRLEPAPGAPRGPIANSGPRLGRRVALVVDLDLGAEVPADHEVHAITAVVGKLDLRELYADVRARGEIAGATDQRGRGPRETGPAPGGALQLDQRRRDLGRPQGGLMDGSAQLTASARRHASHRPQPSARATAAVPESMLDGVFRNGSRRRSRQGWSRDTDFADASSAFTVLRIGSPKIHRIPKPAASARASGLCGGGTYADARTRRAWRYRPQATLRSPEVL